MSTEDTDLLRALAALLSAWRARRFHGGASETSSPEVRRELLRLAREFAGSEGEVYKEVVSPGDGHRPPTLRPFRRRR